MKTWQNATVTMTLAMLASGCAVDESSVFQAKPLEYMKEVPVSEQSKKLDAEVMTFVRDQYAISSAHYYEVSGEIPWIAISKSVQNQMAEKSFQRKMFEWWEPGIDFVEVYPQGNQGDAFGLAMPKNTKSSSNKLVAFYFLKTPAGAKK